METSTQSHLDLNGLQTFKYGLCPTSQIQPETDILPICGIFVKGLQTAALVKSKKASYGNLDSK